MTNLTRPSIDRSPGQGASARPTVLEEDEELLEIYSFPKGAVDVYGRRRRAPTEMVFACSDMWIRLTDTAVVSTLDVGEQAEIGVSPEGPIVAERVGTKNLVRKVAISGFGERVEISGGIYRWRIADAHGRLLARELPLRTADGLTDSQQLLAVAVLASDMLDRMFLPLRALVCAILLNGV